jgi:hypothetical protein
MSGFNAEIMAGIIGEYAIFAAFFVTFSSSGVFPALF